MAKGRAGRTYTRDSNGRFASSGGSTGRQRPASRPAPRGRNRLTRDNSGRITGTGDGATARGGRLRTGAGNLRATQTARLKGQGGKVRATATKSTASQKADLEKILYNGSNSLETRKAARDKLFKLDPSYSIQAGKTTYPPNTPKPLRPAENAGADREQRRKGFLSSMKPMQKAKANAVLEQLTVNNGSAIYRQALIEDFVGKGYKVKIQNGKRRLVAPGGTYFEQSALTKTGLDYADYLARSRAGKKPNP